MPESESPITAVSSQSPDQQLQQLRTYLATSEPFKHCRGKLGKGWMGIAMFDELKSASPTAILEQFDWRNSQARILMNHLAKLRRDGHTVAFEELSRAVTDADFVITGEELPLDKRTPGVLLMYEPARMLELVRWIKLVRPEILDWQLGHPSYHVEEFIKEGHYKDRPGFLPWTKQILAENPELKSGLEKFYAEYPASPRSDHDRSRFMPSSLISDAVKKFPRDDRARHKLKYDVKWLHVGEVETGRNTDVIENWRVACFLPNTTQSQVLSLIQREYQHEVATWQFHYPVHMKDFTGYNASIGLFPEKELPRFQHRWPSFVSNSLSQSMGAVIMERRYGDTDMVDPIFDIDHWRNQESEPDKNEVGLKLHFRRWED